MWSGKKVSAHRPSTVLLIDVDEPHIADLARTLAGRGSHVFYTAAAHVGRRLSQEHYFDLVVIDQRFEDGLLPSLAELIARDGHRCVVLSVPTEQASLPQTDTAVRGALRRPLDAERVYTLAAEVVRNGSFEGYKRHLDLVR